MLQISTFKLIDGGRGGIIIEGNESIQLSNNYQIIDQIKRTRKLILSDTIIEYIQGMKYFFLNCTGHWMAPFNNYYDMVNHKLKPLDPGPDGKIKAGQEMLKDLWNKTEITGISFKSGGFVITGTIAAVEGKKTVINTPFITEEDDLGFFSDAVLRIENSVREIIAFFATHQLPEFKPETILSEEEMKGLNMQELTDKVVEKLVDRNMIMLVNDEGGQKSLEENTDKKTKVSINKNNIDSKNLPEAQHTDDDEDESPADKAIRINLAGNKRDPFGKPASDSEMPEEFKSKDKISPKDLEGLEHSANMGLGGEEQNESEKAEWEE
jgi:hypothetical protein